MRLIVAALLGGIVVFFWGFVSHVALPIGNMGFAYAKAEDPVIAVLRDNLAGEGVYVVPGLTPEQYEDEAATAAYSEKSKANPYALIVYQPQGRDGMQMGVQLAREWATNTVSALAVAWVLSLGAFGFGRRVAVSATMGLFAWLVVSMPYWNWYRFPWEFTLANLIQNVVGWTLAGLVMAWWLGRSAHRQT